MLFHLIKQSSRWALIGVLIGIIVFCLHYFFPGFQLPGYSLWLAPAIFALQFFSPETAFWPKMLIFLGGQYLGYFLLISLLQLLFRGSKTKSCCD